MDFECPACGKVSEVNEVTGLEMDGDKIFALYHHKCPKCGKKYRLTDVYTWDGITQVESA